MRKQLQRYATKAYSIIDAHAKNLEIYLLLPTTSSYIYFGSLA
jgi:hypothetical protein